MKNRYALVNLHHHHPSAGKTPLAYLKGQILRLHYSVMYVAVLAATDYDSFKRQQMLGKDDLSLNMLRGFP